MNAATKKAAAKKPAGAAKKKSTAKKATPAAAKKTAPKAAAVKKTAATTAAKKPAVKKTAKKAAAPKAAAAAHASTKLHYDKAAVVQEYDQTYATIMRTIGISLFGVLLYFFIFTFYLGDKGHTKAIDFVKHFGNRIDYGAEYDGLKLPMFGGDKQEQE